MVSLREGQLQRLEKRSAPGRCSLGSARQPNQFLATIQIGITLAGFLASAAAAVSLAEPLEEPLGFLGNAAGPASIMVVTLALSYVTLVFGELAPKRVAMQKAERWGLLMARPLAFLSKLTRPVVWLLSHSTDIAVRLMGGDPKVQREEVTEEELRDMVACSRRSRPSSVRSSTARSRSPSAPRRDPRAATRRVRHRRLVVVRDRARQLAESGHSRAPVADGGSLDHVTGAVHLRQLLGAGDEPGVDRGDGDPGVPRVGQGADDVAGDADRSGPDGARGRRARRRGRDRDGRGPRRGARRRDLRRDRPRPRHRRPRARRHDRAAGPVPDPRPARHRRRAARGRLQHHGGPRARSARSHPDRRRRRHRSMVASRGARDMRGRAVTEISLAPRTPPPAAVLRSVSSRSSPTPSASTPMSPHARSASP
jgi:hypothetical protein